MDPCGLTQILHRLTWNPCRLTQNTWGSVKYCTHATTPAHGVDNGSGQHVNLPPQTHNIHHIHSQHSPHSLTTSMACICIYNMNTYCSDLRRPLIDLRQGTNNSHVMDKQWTFSFMAKPSRSRSFLHNKSKILCKENIYIEKELMAISFLFLKYWNLEMTWFMALFHFLSKYEINCFINLFKCQSLSHLSFESIISSIYYKF